MLFQVSDDLNWNLIKTHLPRWDTGISAAAYRKQIASKRERAKENQIIIPVIY